jgi:predicted nucleotide-binding protein
MWLTYEAGTLATSHSLICPYLLDLQPSDLKVPFVQFQSARADRSDTQRLVRTLNERSGTDSIPAQVLDRAFELHWPSLGARLSEIQRLAPHPEAAKTLEQKVDEALRLISVLLENARSEPAAAKTTLRVAGVKPQVFIGSSTGGLQVAELIQLGLEHSAECTLWTQSTFAASQTTIESIVDASLRYDFAILVLTADDMIAKRGVEAAAPRDNVVFELGLFTGALGRARTFMVLCRDENIQLPTDLNGVTAVTYARRSDGNLEAALGPVCTRIRQAMGVAQDSVKSR